MGLLGGIIGGAASLVGGVLGAKAANKGYNEAIGMYDDRLKQIRDHRDKLYYQDPTQSAESQAAVTAAQELLNDQTGKAVATNIVTGGTDESVALQKAAAAKAVADMQQAQAVNGAAKRESVWNNADSQINQMTNYIAELKKAKGLNKAKSITDAASGLAGAAGGIL